MSGAPVYILNKNAKRDQGKKAQEANIKAAKAVGDGLYGVDIKQTGNAVYVIEVNDNPSIDSGVEDKYLGKELYELIMQEFADRLEQRGR